MGRSSNSLTGFESCILLSCLHPGVHDSGRFALSTFAMNRSPQYGDFNDPPLLHRQFQTCQSHRSVEAELLSLRSVSATSLSLGSSRQSMDETSTCAPDALRYVYRPCNGNSRPRHSLRRELTKPSNSPAPPSTLTHSTNITTTCPSPTSRVSTDTMIPVGPDQLVRLRGAGETWQAIQQDNYQPCICLDCRAMLFCIVDASFVLCPHCQVMSPLCSEEHSDNAMRFGEGGVGLGFTIDALTERQASLWREV
jgi:hypothetical protein